MKSRVKLDRILRVKELNNIQQFWFLGEQQQWLQKNDDLRDLFQIFPNATCLKHFHARTGSHLQYNNYPLLSLSVCDFVYNIAKHSRMKSRVKLDRILRVKELNKIQQFWFLGEQQQWLQKNDNLRDLLAREEKVKQ